MTGTLRATDEINREREREEVQEDGKRERGGVNCERFRIENKTRREKVLYCSFTFFYFFFYLPPSAHISSDWSRKIKIMSLFHHTRRCLIRLPGILS